METLLPLVQILTTVMEIIVVTLAFLTGSMQPEIGPNEAKILTARQHMIEVAIR